MSERPAGNAKEGHKMADVKVIVGGSIEDDGAAFLDAWRRAERGEGINERVLAFESWEGLAKVMTGERYRLLRHLHKHPEPSVSALARALGRQYRRVHADVAALEQAGLLDRSEGAVRATADRIKADIRL
jgi:predicted transcriptional regulator